jgi:hypothetical protein
MDLPCEARRGSYRLRSPDMAVKARSLMTKDSLNAGDAARVLGMSRRTMFRGLGRFATTMNWPAPMQLIDLRVNTRLRGQVRRY